MLWWVVAGYYNIYNCIPPGWATSTGFCSNSRRQRRGRWRRRVSRGGCAMQCSQGWFLQIALLLWGGSHCINYWCCVAASTKHSSGGGKLSNWKVRQCNCSLFAVFDDEHKERKKPQKNSRRRYNDELYRPNSIFEGGSSLFMCVPRSKRKSNMLIERWSRFYFFYQRGLLNTVQMNNSLYWYNHYNNMGIGKGAVLCSWA